MRTYKLYKENGSLFAFEIENAYIRPKKIGILLGVINGVTKVRVRKSFNLSDDVHVQFKYQDNDFIVWEPYGDNSRYWIGPSNEENSLDVDIEPLEEAFKNYKPQFLFKIFGDLMSLHFLKKRRSSSGSES